MRYDELDEPCSITRSLVVLGDRWTLLILKYCFAGVRRFNALQECSGISRGRLQDRLERLVHHEILVKDQSRSRPEYRLTDKGRALYPILIALKDWGDAHMSPDGPPLLYHHRDCRGQAHTQVTCDDCQGPLTARDVVVTAGPGLDPGRPQ